MSEEQPNGLGAAINDAMSGANFDEPSESAGNPDVSRETSQPEGDSTQQTTPPAKEWDKVERRASNDDPEHELDYEEEVGKGKAKVKLSELKGNAKFLFDNRQSFASILKIQNEAKKNPKFGELLDKVITKAYEGGNYNQAFVDKQLSSLAEQKEVIQDKIEDKTDDIKDAEAALAELDPDSHQAKILSRNISFMKNARAELQSTKNELNTIKTTVNDLNKFKTDFQSNQDKQAHQVEVKRLSDVYDKEIGALTDVNKKDGYKFIDNDEKGDFDSSVRSMVAQADKDGKINNEADFVKAVQTSAKVAYERMAKRREAYVSDYLRKKTGGKLPEEPKKEPEQPKHMDFNDMGEAIANAISSSNV